MATAIFPREIDVISLNVTPTFSVRTHRTERHIERRTKSLGPSADLDAITRRYQMVMNDEEVDTQIDLIYNFFIARHGAYENFFLPSFYSDTTFASVDGTGTVVTVADASVFNTTQDKYGNWIYFWDVSAETGEVRRISNIAGNDVTITSALGSSYDVGDYVEICPLVRWDKSRLSKDSRFKPYWTLDSLNFIDVFEYGSVVL